MIYFAGLTTRPFKTRVKEHIKEYRKGTYTIFDTESLLNGKRVEIWHGMWFKKATKTPEMMNKFILRSNELQPEIEKLLSTFRIFLAPLNVDKRALWRIEAAIMNNLYKANEPFKNIPDKGMHLSPRWKRETPFLVFNQSNIQFHGLQQCFEA